MIPVFIKELNTDIFILSGIVSLACTLTLIIIIYRSSSSTRTEIHKGKLILMVSIIYSSISLFYFFKLIPPVPLALNSGIVAHDIQLENGKYIVSYETDEWYVFWRDHSLEYIHEPNEKIYVFSSIFAPTALEKTIFHRWKWYNNQTENWELMEDIGYDITGGRDGGYRGYTYKQNLKLGIWKVEVLTEEELVLGVVDFEIIVDPTRQPKGIVQKKF